MIKTAAVLLVAMSLVACRPASDAHATVARSVAAGLIGSVIKAQSIDSAASDSDAKFAECNSPCEPRDVAPVETCSLKRQDAATSSAAAIKRAPRQKA